jgi:hypothetical protein
MDMVDTDTVVTEEDTDTVVTEEDTGKKSIQMIGDGG